MTGSKYTTPITPKRISPAVWGPSTDVTLAQIEEIARLRAALHAIGKILVEALGDTR